jgi:hypothetical protein
MKIERFTIQACCGGKSIIFKTGEPVTAKLLNLLVANGFHEATHFTKAGMLYVDNLDLIVTAPLGSDRLQVKCKKADCDQKLNDFEEFLLKQG